MSARASSEYGEVDQIARGLRLMIEDRIKTTGRSLVGVVFSSADVMALIDAYEELRRG